MLASPQEGTVATTGMETWPSIIWGSRYRYRGVGKPLGQTNRRRGYGYGMETVQIVHGESAIGSSHCAWLISTSRKAIRNEIVDPVRSLLVVGESAQAAFKGRRAISTG